MNIDFIVAQFVPDSTYSPHPLGRYYAVQLTQNPSFTLRAICCLGVLPLHGCYPFQKRMCCGRPYDECYPLWFFHKLSWCWCCSTVFLISLMMRNDWEMIIKILTVLDDGPWWWNLVIPIIWKSRRFFSMTKSVATAPTSTHKEVPEMRSFKGLLALNCRKCCLINS